MAAALLARAHMLVSQWLPAGCERNGRWYIGDFDGNPGDSANVNLTTGQWIDNAAPDEDCGGDLTSLYARIRGISNSQAARELIEQFRWERDFLRSRPGSSAGRPEPAAAEPDANGGGAHQEPPADPGQTPTARADAQAGGRGERWRSILPVPAHAPNPKRFTFGFKDSTAGEWRESEATRVWPYEFEGQRLGYVARFERINSRGELVKDLLPLTWCEDLHDPRRGQRWHWKQWAAPRPLYVPAALLSAGPHMLPAVIAEGEKCAEAGHRLLGHEFDFVSWPGGCKAWALARWALLRGRTVYLWPDADAKLQRLTREERERGVDPATKPPLPLAKQPGYQAMVGIGQLLQAEHDCTVYIVRMPEPGGRPKDGWDIADAIDEGWDAARVRDYIRAAHALRGPDDAVRAAAGLSTPSTAAAREEASAADDDAACGWVRYLLRAEKTDAVRAVRENVVIALDGRPEKGVPGIEACAGLIRFNAFSNNVEKSRPTPWGTTAGDWQEADELLMGDWLVREQRMPSMSRQILEEAVLVVAHRHTWHPLREKVEGLRGKWDKVQRLDTWLARVLLEEDEHDEALTEYLKRVGRWFVMGMCARVMAERRVGKTVVCGPGTKFDYMLVLEGPQGWCKSTFASVLAGDYFADTGLDIQHKDSLMNIQGVWVYEWSELESLAKAEVGSLKRFISSPVDRFRATFDRRPAKYPRQVVFVGTTNERHYLFDTTGNRRFWPVRVTRPADLDWLRENIEQMLAEAVAAVDANERFYPTREEQARWFDPQQRERTVESSLEAAIRTFLYDEQQKVALGQANGALVNEIGLQELLTRVGYAIDKQTDVVSKRAGQVMHMLGWTTRRPGADEDGKRPRIYVRPREPARLGLTAGASPSSFTGPTQGPATGGSADDPPF